MLAAAGDTLTQEIVAAAWLLRKHVPALKVRVVNVVDLMCLAPPDVHPHGLPEDEFLELFTADRPVVFGFHGYQRAVHAIVHGRPRAERFHVRGFMEEGTTTTPFDMVVKNAGQPLSPLPRGAAPRAPRAGEPVHHLVQRDADEARGVHPRERRGSAGDPRLGLDRRMSILVLNAGSSSLKLGLYDDGAVALASGSVDWGADAEQAEVRVRWVAGGEAEVEPPARRATSPPRCRSRSKSCEPRTARRIRAARRARSAPWASAWCRGARSCRRACASTRR